MELTELAAVFTDLDGTLLDSDHKIMPKTKALLRDLYHNNVIIVPVSARMPATITSITDAVATDLPVIAYNGALILDPERKQLSGNTINDFISIEIYNYVKHNNPDVCICVYYNNDWIVDDIKDPRIQTEIKAVGLTPAEMPIDKYIKTVGEVHKLFIVGDPDQTDKLVNVINRKWNNVFACKSRDIFIEITAREASKGNAVKKFTEKLGVNLSKSIAFGDQINDFDMLRAVGIGVAMGNSTQEVINAADFVTDTNDNEGIYKFLKDY